MCHGDEQQDGELKIGRDAEEKPQREQLDHDDKVEEQESDDGEQADESNEDDGEDEDGREDQETRKKRRPFVPIIALVVLVLLSLGAVYYWLSTRNIVDTDDAYTDGYVQNIAPQVRPRGLARHRGHPVRQARPGLIHIDPRSFIDDREQAQAQLDTAKAQFAGQKLAAEVAKKNSPAALQVAQPISRRPRPA